MTVRKSTKLAILKNGLVKAFYLFGLLFINTLSAQQNNTATDNAPTLIDQQIFQQELDRWMLSAYEGDRNSQFQVAMAFISDQMGEPDYEQAVYWYKQAARQGHVIAQYNLGHQYMTGQGVQKSERQAIQWWEKAARQGHSLAQFNLGRAYYLGIGVDKNEQQSRFWFEQAALNNEPKSLEILQQLGWDNNLPSIEPIEIADSVTDKEADSITDKEADSVTDNNETSETDQLSEADIETEEEQFTSRIIPVETVENNNDEQEIEAPKQTISSKKRVAPDADISTGSTAESETVESETVEPETQSNEQSIVINVVEEGDSQNISASSTNSNTDTETINQTSTDNQTATDNNEESEETAPALTKEVKASTVNRSVPLAVYTNPSVRSILIGLVDDVADIAVVKKADKWIQIESSSLPVWVHSDFLEVLDNTGTVNGKNVNVRAVPLVVNGSKVGKLNTGDKVRVLESRNGWHRITSTTMFKAWAKVTDYENALVLKESLKKSIKENLNEEKLNQNISAPLIAETNNNNDETDQPQGWATKTNLRNDYNDDNSTEASATIKQTSASEQSVDTSQTTKQVASADNDVKASVLNENDNSWLFAQSHESYTLQLASFDDEQKVNAFLAKQEQINNDQLHRFTATSNGINWTYFLYGSYKTVESASQARKNINLPKAWIRSFKHLTQNRCISWKKQLPPPRELKRYCLN